MKPTKRRITFQSADDQVWHALVWQYGCEQANYIVRGLDPKTEADRQSWRSLGTRVRGSRFSRKLLQTAES